MKSRLSRKDHSGFTLVEISIVLLIIGLIVGGIMVGSEMIAAAYLRKVITQENEFEIAVNAFKAKYNCMPGDCRFADEIFGSICGDASTDQVTGCNGDGNERIDNFLAGEYLKFWQHLYLSAMIRGPYSGRGAPTGNGPETVPGVNTPISSLNGIQWNVMICLYAAFTDPNRTRANTNGFCLGGSNPPNQSSVNWLTQVTNMQAYRIDTKADDGIPISGRVVGDKVHDFGIGTCADSVYPVKTNPNSRNCTLTFVW